MDEKNKNRSIDKFNLKEVIGLLIIVALVSIATGFAVANRVLKDKYVNNDVSSDSKLDTFIQNYNYIVDNYYGEVDEDKLLDAALAGMLEALDDPYTVYINEEQVDNFNIKLEGSYEGLGIEIYINNDNKLEVLTVFEDSPAEKAGIKSGDIMIKLDGEDITGLDSQQFVDKIKTKGNKKISLTVERDGENVDLTITRQKVSISSVIEKTFEIENKKIGYLGISIFANNTYVQVKEKLEDLEKQNIDSLIIDVRGNTGGHLTSVENILGLFLDKTHVIYNIEDENGKTAVYSDGKKTADYPIIILTNELSASASEILTAALKEELGAKSIGAKTYGKGSAQELRTLPDGTQYKITTKKWLTPKGNSIDGVGVDVDLSVVFDSSYYNDPIDENDNQLQAAIKMLME